MKKRKGKKMKGKKLGCCVACVAAGELHIRAVLCEQLVLFRPARLPNTTNLIRPDYDSIPISVYKIGVSMKCT